MGKVCPLEEEESKEFCQHETYLLVIIGVTLAMLIGYIFVKLVFQSRYAVF